VNVETFGWVISWFGSLHLTFLERMHSVVYSPWFHGDISAQETERLLQSCSVGTFVVRLSSSNFGGYALSYVLPSGKINHYRFCFNLQKSVFILMETQYSTISALLEDKRSFFQLKMPCLGSKYTTLYTEMESGGYIGQ